MKDTGFWMADICWEKEPVEQLSRLHSQLAADRVSALRGFEGLASEGSLAAAIYLAMELDRLPEGKADEEAAARWYDTAAVKGSRAAAYRLGIMRQEKGDLLKAEAAFRLGDALNFPPSMYRLACLYIDDVQGLFASKDRATIRDLLERSSELDNLFSTRDLGTLYLNGKLWPRQPSRGIYLLSRLLPLIAKALFYAARGNVKADEMLRG